MAYDNKLSLILGDIDIGSYIKVHDVEHERLKLVKEKVNELEKNCLESEKAIYHDLYSEMISSEYPLINLGFLEKNYEKKIGEIIQSYLFLNLRSRKVDKIIKVPSFSIYSFYDTNKFSINLISYGFDGGGRVEIGPSMENKEFPLAIIKPILKSLGVNNFVKNKIKSNFYDINPSEHFDWQGYNIKLQSQFNGLIPHKTKEKVKEAEKYFNKDNIYIVTETKPEDWNVLKFEKDPLVFGIIGERNAHLIDHFNTTVFENLIKNVYNHNNLI